MTNNVRNNRFDYIELPAPDAKTLVQAKQFYAQAFGWEYKDWGAEYADTQSSGVNSGIAVNARGAGQMLAVIFSSDLEGARAGVLGAGAKITKDIFSFPGGRRFHFVDPAGNELAVWSDK